MAVRSFIGSWEVIGYGYINGSHNESTRLEGVRFRLDETGDVVWTVSEELKTVPLFSCETYEIYTTSILGTVLRFGAYAGHVIEFKCDQVEPRDNVVLTCEGWCMLHCKRIQEESNEYALNTTFSLLPALEDGYFGDLKIVAANNKQFEVHSSILQLLGNEIPWHSQPPPFSGLPEDVLGTILNFLYAECLPENFTESTARQVIAVGSQRPSLSKLVNMCQLFLKNMALKQQIIGLVSDMHAYANQIIEHFNIRHNHSPTDTIASNPVRLCFVVKQSIRDAAVVGAKLLLLCDLFTKRKNELSKEERHEIIRYAKSRLPIFMTQLYKFLQAIKNTFSSMTVLQRNEVATYLVPETEIILDTVSALIVEIEKALHQMIQVLSPHDEARRKSSVGDVLGKSLRNVLHIKELTKLRNFHEQITCSLDLLIHRKEIFYDMTPAQKVRSVARTLEQLIEELPIFLLRLEEVRGALDEKLEWREFKFCFKVGTSKVSGVLQKLVSHRSTLQDVMVQVCELIQRDAFTQSLYNLGLFEASKVTTHSDDYQRTSTASSSTPKQYPHGYTLNLVESLCVPPSSVNSNLSKFCLQLLKNEVGTDMEFEIITSNSTSDQTVREHARETSSPVEFESSIIKAHRVVVAARCDWFRRALLSGMREAIDKKITVHDTNPNIFQIFLEYLYSGRIRQNSLTTDQLAELLLLSDRYEVDSLKQACEYGLHSSIDEDSVLYFLSMADQYNAQILRNACLNFISTHNEITDSELFYELPVALQAEIFDCIWTQPPSRKAVPADSGLPTSRTPTSPESSISDIQKINSGLHFMMQASQSNSSSMEELPLSQDTARLENSLAQLRDIVGDTAPREKLVQVVLAADFDLCRAVNYFYSKLDEPQL